MHGNNVATVAYGVKSVKYRLRACVAPLGKNRAVDVRADNYYFVGNSAKSVYRGGQHGAVKQWLGKFVCAVPRGNAAGYNNRATHCPPLFRTYCPLRPF